VLEAMASSARRFVFALAVCSFWASAASAQIDTPAAREARAALQAVQDTYGGYAQWKSWSTALNLLDVQCELLAGDRGRPDVMHQAVVTLLSGSIPEFSEPAFLRLAKALDVRLQELAAIPVGEWPSACQQAAANYRPITAETVADALAACRRRLEALANFYSPVRNPGDHWNTFLYWGEIQALANNQPGPAPDPQVLDRIETRWAAAPTIWDEPRLYEASLSVRILTRLLRGHLVAESAEQHAAVWNELGEMLAGLGENSSQTAAIAAAVNRRESLGQASRLTMSIRRALSQPNLVLRVDRQWIESQFVRQIDEPFEVNDVFAGTRSVGRGVMTGTVRAEVLPSSAVGRLLLRFSGTSYARASGTRDRVSVVSRATTRISASKPLLLDARGLTPDIASAGAVTNIVYESIDAPGLPRRRSQAISETHARRPQAERDGAAIARQTILKQINDEAAQVARDFNQAYHADLRDPRVRAFRPAPQIRVRSAGSIVDWQCLLEGPSTFGAPSVPPQDGPSGPVVLSVAASALEEQGVMNLSGKTMTGDELSESLGGTAQRAPSSSGDAFQVRFASDPCDVRFEEGTVRVRLFIDHFESEDVKYPPMSVDVAYEPQVRNGRIVLVRQGRVRVTPRATADDQAPKVSGRQQTLRLGVERKLSKVMTAELEGEDVRLPLAGERETRMHVNEARLVGDWLQLGLSPEDESGRS
jgi:hypothetical protein